MKIVDPPYILFQLQESTQKNLQKGPHSLIPPAPGPSGLSTTVHLQYS